jgi:hypothetical protein
VDVSAIAPPAPITSTFPAAEVEACLRDELIDAIKMEALARGVSLPSAPAQIAKTIVQVDSLVVVTILIAVEQIVEFELPETVVRAGGYLSVEKAIEQLLPRIEQEWNKRKGATP